MKTKAIALCVGLALALASCTDIPVKESSASTTNGIIAVEMANGDVCYYLQFRDGISCVAHR